MNRICKKCEKELSFIFFSIYNRKMRNGSYKKYFRIYCRDCERLKSKKYRADHPEYTKIYNSKTDVKDRKKQWELEHNIIQLRQHIERQFDDNMNWDNYGIYWHIDHIIPQSCLPYTSMEEDNFKKCWALNNLRPLEAKENMTDGSTRIRHKMYTNLIKGVI